MRWSVGVNSQLKYFGVRRRKVKPSFVSVSGVCNSSFLYLCPSSVSSFFSSSFMLPLLPSWSVSSLLSLFWFLLNASHLFSYVFPRLPSSLILLLLILSFTPLQHNRTCQLFSITQCNANYFYLPVFSFLLSSSWPHTLIQNTKIQAGAAEWPVWPAHFSFVYGSQCLD